MASLISGGGGQNGGDKALSSEQINILRKMDGFTLMAHEFLYLLCNSSARLDYIEKNHKKEYRSEKQKIYHWEL